MNKRLYLLILVSTFLVAGFTLDKHQKAVDFFVGDGEYVKRLDFHFNSPFGFSQIRAVDNPDLLRIHGIYDQSKLKPQFYKKNSRGVKEAKLTLLDQGSGDELTQYSGIKNEWEIYLSQKKMHNLFLNFGSGNSNINLSNLSVCNLNLRNNHASVTLDYLTARANKCDMKSMELNNNRGYIKVSNARLAKVKKIKTKVKYGTVSLDFSGKPLIETTIAAKVGGGVLRIDLPDAKYPVKISVKGDDFSTTNLPKGFKEISDGTFANPHYYVNAPYLLEINVELGLGKLVIN